MMPDDISLGHLLKIHRAFRDLKQHQLADLAGLTAASVSRWENGQGIPTFENVVRLVEREGGDAPEQRVA